MAVKRFTLDTNILIYSIDSQAGARQRMARQVFDCALRCDCWPTLQAVSAFYAVATCKGRMAIAEAAAQAGFVSVPAKLANRGPHCSDHSGGDAYA